MYMLSLVKSRAFKGEIIYLCVWHDFSHLTFPQVAMSRQTGGFTTSACFGRLALLSYPSTFTRVSSPSTTCSQKTDSRMSTVNFRCRLR